MGVSSGKLVFDCQKKSLQIAKKRLASSIFCLYDLFMDKKKKHILGYHKSTVSLFKSGKRKPSWNLAQKLCERFPGKSIWEWKNSSPGEIARAFEQLQKEASGEV